MGFSLFIYFIHFTVKIIQTLLNAILGHFSEHYKEFIPADPETPSELSEYLPNTFCCFPQKQVAGLMTTVVIDYL